MDNKARATYIRTTPRKLKLIATAIRHQKLDKAITNLNFLNKSGSLELQKVLKQARANAMQNQNIKSEKLIIKNIQILEGPVLKRGKPVSRGMWHTIKKRTSHINVVVGEGE